MMRKEEVRIGFIGFGNMAQAMAEGLILRKAVTADRIRACAAHWDRLCRNAEKYGIRGCAVRRRPWKSRMWSLWP